MNILDLIDENFDWNCIEEKYEHGKLISYEFAAYCDVKTYEDGYVDSFYLCD